MNFFYINKNKQSTKNIQKEYLPSFEIFEKRGQKERIVFNTDKFYLSIFDGKNSKCYIDEFENGDFIVTLGNLFYRDNFGKDCLQFLYNDFKNGERDLYNNLKGSYSVLIFVNNELYVFNDFLGLMRVYNTEDGSFFSTSFLAIAKGLKVKTPSTQEIYEYIIRGGMYGDKTVLKEINLIPRSTVVCMNGESLNEKLKFVYERLPFYNDYNEMLEYVSAEYMNIFKSITNTFGENITTALSGGYDSRLMLALLRKNGITPKLYVYGTENSSDVIVAKRIAKGENFSINHIDRNIYGDIEINDFADIVENNFIFYDGLGTFGIFDDGRDVISRRKRSSEGILQLNGAGGEVWRDFWGLNPLKKKSIDFVRHKWDIYNYKAYSDKFNKKRYFNNFTHKLEQSINFPDNRRKLTRKEMEMSYPLFRYRYWQSIGNSINLNFSYTLMPLMETSLLYPSFDLPIQKKYNGRFEAALIRKIDPKLASYPSNYGHNFMGRVPVKSKTTTFVKRNIPLSVKPLIRYMHSNAKKANSPYYLDEPYVEEVLDFKNMFISEYIDISKLNDPLAKSRALTLEYFFRNI